MAVESERCTARSKRSHERCKRQVPGGGVCHMHGRNGAAERSRQARIMVAEARDLFADRFIAREWYDALPAAAALTDQLMQALRDKVELAGTLTATELDALAALAERTARLQKLVQDSNLDERRVKINERQGQLVADAITAILADLGLSLSEPRVMQVVSRRLTELSGGAE